MTYDPEDGWPEGLDLATLKWVKGTFDLYSDMSSKCHGYDRLCREIEEIENSKK